MGIVSIAHLRPQILTCWSNNKSLAVSPSGLLLLHWSDAGGEALYRNGHKTSKGRLWPEGKKKNMRAPSTDASGGKVSRSKLPRDGRLSQEAFQRSCR